MDALYDKKTISVMTDNPFDVKQYPEKFAEHVANVEKEVRDNKWMALIVCLRDAEGKTVPRIDYHVDSRCGNMSSFPCMTTDGWFGTVNLLPARMRQVIESQGIPDMYKTGEFYVFTATNRPVTIKIPVALGKVYYADVVLEKTLENELISVSGTVLDEDNNPMGNVSVHLRVMGGRGTTTGLK